jgi:hypothetical protein
MFGHQDDRNHDDENRREEEVVAPDTTATADVPAHDAHAPAGEDAAPASGGHDADDTKTDDSAASDDDKAWQHPGAPLSHDDDNDDTAGTVTPDADEPEEDEDEASDDSQGPAPINDIVGTSAGPDFKPFPGAGSDGAHTDRTPHDLIDIKQKALTDLAPLVSQLDQTPEDKFRTLLMMVQAGDDQNLLKTAYEAAHEIKDEKLRAQALLDVVNEINYFTQHPQS